MFPLMVKSPSSSCRCLKTLCYFDASVQTGIAKDCTNHHKALSPTAAAVPISGWSCFSSDCITSESQGILTHADCSLMLSHKQVHTCTYIHPYTHTYIQTYIHPYMQTYIQTYIHTDIHAYVHTYMALKSCPVSHPDHRPLDIRDLLS